MLTCFCECSVARKKLIYGVKISKNTFNLSKDKICCSLLVFLLKWFNNSDLYQLPNKTYNNKYPVPHDKQQMGFTIICKICSKLKMIHCLSGFHNLESKINTVYKQIRQNLRKFPFVLLKIASNTLKPWTDITLNRRRRV